MNIENIERNIKPAAILFKALANENRLRVVCTLHKKECSVNELKDVIGLSQSALSQHLARLRRDKIVKTRRDAQTIYYSINDPNRIDCLKQCMCTLYKEAA